jgi:hypothetical protein
MRKQVNHFTWDFGNGIYFFELTGSSFGENLSRFIGQHPEMSLASVCNINDNETINGKPGHFVFFNIHIPR